MYLKDAGEQLVLNMVTPLDARAISRYLAPGDLIKVHIKREPDVRDRETRTKLDKTHREGLLRVKWAQLDGNSVKVLGLLEQGHHTALIKPGDPFSIFTRDESREKFLWAFENSQMDITLLCLDASTAYIVKVGVSAVVVKERELDWSKNITQYVLEFITDYKIDVVSGPQPLCQPLAKALKVRLLTNSAGIVPPFIPNSRVLKQLMTGSNELKRSEIENRLLKAHKQRRLVPLERLSQYQTRIERIYLFTGSASAIPDNLLARVVLVDEFYTGFTPYSDVIELFCKGPN